MWTNGKNYGMVKSLKRKGDEIMSVVRVNKTQNFTVMSNWHFREKKMSLKAKGLLSLMLSLPPEWNYSIAGLVALSKDGKDGVMSALNELQKFGYLIRVRMTDERGRFAGYEYNIFEQPQTPVVEELPFAENPNAVKPNTDKPNAENPPLLNTKELNTKELSIKSLNTILNTIEDIELRNLYVDYVEMRRIIKAPLTKRAFKMIVDRVERLAPLDIKKQKELLETAIINNWKNVYPPKEEKKAKSANDFMDKLKEMYE